jgi:hypothetical protein
MPMVQRTSIFKRQQAQAATEASFLVALVALPAPICGGGFRSGLNAPRRAGRRPTLQPPPQIPQSKDPTTRELVYFPAARVV